MFPRYRRRIVVLAVIALLAAPMSEAQTGPGPALRARGLLLGYNLDHAEPLATFRTASDADPQDPAAYRLAAATAWTKLLFDQGAITAADYLGPARATLPRAPPDGAPPAAITCPLARA